MSFLRSPSRLLLSLSFVALLACDPAPPEVDGGPDAGALDAGPLLDAGSDAGGDAGAFRVPLDYEFQSRFDSDSSVNHSGQSARQVLLLDLVNHARALDEAVVNGDGAFADGVTDGEVLEQLEYFFSIDAADRANDPIRLMTTPEALQGTYGEINGSATLFSKLAGQDTVTDHRDWSTEFSGWSDASFAAGGGDVGTPAGFVRAIFHRLEDNAASRVATPRMSPIDAAVELPVHLEDNGIDLAILLEAFLHGAVSFSQASDDYLDDDAATPGKGLLAGHDAAEDGENYTALEHAWDEGLGYFGAPSNFPIIDVSEGELDGDFSGDGRIDLTSERAFGAAIMLAERDTSSIGGSRTNFALEGFRAFRTGRAILAFADGPLDSQEAADLAAERDVAIASWEAGAAATVVHHINRILQLLVDGALPDHDAYTKITTAFSWAKGLALMFQFNPRSAVSAADFTALHAALGDSATVTGDFTAFRAGLLEARGILATSFTFAAPNVGDENGDGGW